jgi:hypothetical protein
MKDIGEIKESELGNTYFPYFTKDFGDIKVDDIITKEEYDELPEKEIRLFTSIANRRLTEEDETFEEYQIRRAVTKERAKLQKKGIQSWKSVITREIDGKMYQMGNTFNKEVAHERMKEILKQKENEEESKK